MNWSSRLTNQQGSRMKPFLTKLCPACVAKSFRFVVGPLKSFQWCLWYVFTFLLTLGILFYIRTMTNIQLETSVTIFFAFGAMFCNYLLDIVVLWTTFESTFHSIMLWGVIYTVFLIGEMNKDQRKFVESQCACSNATKST
jgi:hypothetical protein